MAVSLKKSVKVDLSKPELPQKMREYTPIHLMDEEETIKKTAADTNIVSPPSSETESQTDTEVDTCCKSSKLGRCLMKAFCVLSPLIACAVSIFSLYALPNMLASVCPTDGLEGEIFSIVKSVFTNPIVALMLIILWLSVFVRNIRKVGKM